MANKPARKAVTVDFENLLLSHLPASVPQLVIMTREKPRTVQNAIKRMHANGLVLISAWERSTNGGPAVRIYAVRTEAESDAPRDQVINRYSKRECEILSLLPASVPELVKQTKGGGHHVQTLVRHLYRRGVIRVCEWRAKEGGGPPLRVYGHKAYVGHADMPCTLKAMTPSQRRKIRLTEDDTFLRREAARRQVKKLIKAGGDEMINLLFGRVREAA